MADYKYWVRQADTDVWCPVTERMEVVTGLNVMASQPPEGTAVGSFFEDAEGLHLEIDAEHLWRFVPMLPVKSSDLAAVGWYNDVLWVKFQNGGVYEYRGVPQGRAQDLLQAPSKGKHFHQHIKGKFSYIKRA
jgi:hypothetical protein